MLGVGCDSAKQADFTGSVGNPGGGASDLAGASMSVTDMAQPIVVLDLSTPPPTEDMTNGGGCVTGSSCYTGPAGTLGVGACKAGTQTCGAGGTCTGEV